MSFFITPTYSPSNVILKDEKSSLDSNNMYWFKLRSGLPISAINKANDFNGR